ncbi:glycosyltransferase [uncultured Dokdonia sp.]|uniref:glycosyltransferase family 2 protein n=1 Tax=uncultured Dokdonia sp. TaxID=575653 RepID=UPI0030EF07C3|tara:strand:+ start:48861 stop:49748 length:888 start_codon:yes stop_codon:yes gene_type:complete
MKPLVSICIPTYNGASYLQEALDSVNAQTYEHIEVIISDDMSSDDTLVILERFCESSIIPIYILEHTPSGIGANWNHTLQNANGEFIKFLFQDDILAPECIEELVEVISASTRIGLVASKRSFIVESSQTEEVDRWIAMYGNLQASFEEQEKLTKLDSDFIGREDFLDPPFNKVGEPPVTLFRKSLLDEIGFFDEDLRQILDYTFYYRVLKKYDIVILNKELAKFRLHDKQATNVNRHQQIDDHERYDEILYNEFYSYLHPVHKKRLYKKFSYKARLKRLVKRIFKKLKQNEKRV